MGMRLRKLEVFWVGFLGGNILNNYLLYPLLNNSEGVNFISFPQRLLSTSWSMAAAPHSVHQ